MDTFSQYAQDFADEYGRQPSAREVRNYANRPNPRVKDRVRVARAVRVQDRAIDRAVMRPPFEVIGSRVFDAQSDTFL